MTPELDAFFLPHLTGRFAAHALSVHHNRRKANRRNALQVKPVFSLKVTGQKGWAGLAPHLHVERLPAQARDPFGVAGENPADLIAGGWVPEKYLPERKQEGRVRPHIT